MTAPLDHFHRLERGFAAQGWRLYSLGGTALLVSATKRGMSRVLPDLRAAQVLLRQIGGA